MKETNQQANNSFPWYYRRWVWGVEIILPYILCLIFYWINSNEPITLKFYEFFGGLSTGFIVIVTHILGIWPISISCLKILGFFYYIILFILLFLTFKEKKVKLIYPIFINIISAISILGLVGLLFTGS